MLVLTMSMGKILGIDYGTKRIGLSISDVNRRLATPLQIVFNDSNIFNTLAEILKNEKITEVVIGESVDFSGKLNALSARIEVFILELQEKLSAQGGPAPGGKLPIHKQKEFLTSVEARRSGINKATLSPSQAHSKAKQIKTGRVDAKAAAIILQRYLDRKSGHKEV